MFEQDYIMRLISEIVRIILKLLFHIDTETPSGEVIEDEEVKKRLYSLLDMVDAGQVCEAENQLYEMTSDENLNNLEVGLLFYSYLNDKEDAFLEKHHYSREEVKQGVIDLAERYGLSSMVELFLMEL